MKTVIRVVSLLTAILLCIPLISSCDSDNSAGLVKSIEPKNAVGRLITTASEFAVKTKRSTDADTLKKSIAVTPDTDFNLTGSGSSYTLKFNSALAADKVYSFSSLCGGRTVYEWAFQTSPDFKVTGVSLPKSLDDKKISFTFSYSDVSGFDNCFSISPEVEGTFSNNNKTWTFTANEPFNPETNYTVTLKKSVRTPNGLTLEKDYTTKFTTPEPSGNFASVVRDDIDYACNYLPDEVPQVLIKSRGLKDKKADVSVYKFNDYKSYLNAHKTYFEAPDLSHADKLIPSLKLQSSFNAELSDYLSAGVINAEKANHNEYLLTYPVVYSAGYYLSVIKLGGNTLYHLFRVSPLSVYTLTCGNTLTVWVNSSKTGRPLFDSEVILDSTYDEKTDENGVVRFSLTENDKRAAYLVISDPSNSNLPFVAYVPLTENNEKTKVTAEYNCVMYSDRDTCKPGDAINIFGAVRPVSGTYSAASAQLEYTIGKNSDIIGVSPDKNGAFCTKITAPEAPDASSGTMNISLKIDNAVIKAISVNIAENTANTQKIKVDDTFLSAAFESGILTISANNVSTSPSADCSLNLAASEKFGAAVYNTGTANVDYTISVIKHTLYQKQKSGDYYDGITKSIQPQYVYNRINKTETVETISGKTVNGTSVRIISQKNEPQNGVYYSCKISYKTKSGKTAVYECANDFSNADSYNSSEYHIAFDNSASANGTIGAAVLYGNKTVNSGTVLCVPTYYNAYSAQLFAADKISFKPSGEYPGNILVCAAYFDGRQVYALNQSIISQSEKDYSLNVSVSSDKAAYAKGDTVKLNIKVTDSLGKAVNAPIGVCIKQADTADYIGTSAFDYAVNDNIDENTSGYNYGITRTAVTADTSAKTRENTDSAVYFDLITADSSGKAEYSFTANEYGKKYICEVLAFSGYKNGCAAVYTDCSQKAAVDISASDKITVNDNFIITAKAENANESATSAVSSTSSTSDAAASDTATTAVSSAQTADDKKNTESADLQYHVTAAIYSAAKKGETDYDEKLKLQSAQQTLSAGQTAALSFGKLAAGKYTYIAEYEHLSEKRTVRGSFTVSAEDTVLSPKILNLTKSGISLDKSDSNVGAIVYKSAYSPMFDLACRLYSGKSDNLSQSIAQLAATDLLGGHIDGSQLKKYQKNGLLYTEKENADLYYTAAAAALCANYADRHSLISYFNGYIVSDDDTAVTAAYFGLAALHEPVLDTLYSLNNSAAGMTDRQKLYLALAFAYIGDYDSAKTLCADIYSEKQNDSVLAVTDELKSDDDIMLGCMLYCKLNDSAAQNMMEYLLKSDKNKVNSKYEYLCYAQYLLSYVTGDEKRATLTEKTDVKAKKSSFRGCEFYKTNIKSENLEKTTLSSNDDLYICLLYTVKAD